MSKKHRNWRYADAKTSMTGTMICTCCNRPITSGEYRYFETGEAYHSQHRSCSEHDPAWLKIDREWAEHLERQRNKLTAYKEFRDKWDESALDEEIENLEQYLESVK
jgi:hypothetical protein